MALWQFGYLVRERHLSADAGTVYVDLPSNEQIGALLLAYGVTSAGAETPDNSRSVLDVVSDIQVLLEGSKTAYRATPHVGSFIECLANSTAPAHLLNTVGPEECNLIIPFGRYFLDSTYMLDTSRYASAQLQFTYALNTDLEATGTFWFTVGFWRPVEKVNPMGFIRHRIVVTHESSGSAEVWETNLPTGLKWLWVGARMYRWGSYLADLASDIDLDVGEGRLHLFQGGIYELITWNMRKLGTSFAIPQSIQALADGVRGATFLGTPHHVAVTEISSTASASAVSALNGTSFTLEAGAVTSATPFMVKAFGGNPFSGILIFDGSEGPFNPAQYADASLEVRYNALASLTQVFVSEVVEGVL